MKKDLVSKVAKVGVSALLSSILMSVTSPVAIADAGATNSAVVLNAMTVATETNSTGTLGVPTTTMNTAARSYNLTYIDDVIPASGVARTATVVSGGVLSIYFNATTSMAISATGGTISASATADTRITAENTSGSTGTAFTFSGTLAATNIAVLWSAGTTTGRYTVSLNQRNIASGIPSTTNPLLGNLVSTLVVNVVPSSHPSVGGTNIDATRGTKDRSLFTAVAENTGRSAVLADINGIPGEETNSTALSKGLLYKDSSYSTAQTATVLTSGELSLYAVVSTTAAFTASGGTFSSSTDGSGTITPTFSGSNRTALLVGASADKIATTVATIWTAPSTAGTYTVSLYVGDGVSAPTIGSPSVYLAGNITVTVVAASAGGAYSAANSACYLSAGSGAVTTDSTTPFQNGASAYIQLNLNDAYGTDLDNGNIVATATNGGLISLGTGSQAVGTASTVVAYDNAASAGDTYGTVRLSQPTAGAPLTSTVTITYNGTTVCTKTVTISGAADSMTIGYVGSGDIGTGTANAYWLINETGVSTGRTAGHYLVALKDSAGNIVNPASGDSFSMDSATTTTTVTALTVSSADFATSTAYSASNYWSWTPGTFTCGPVAGSSKVKLKHTNAATGKIVSGEFTARCADAPATYTASFDKASYVQGEIATLTVKFFDSKGNAANSTDAIGALTETVSMMTRVTGVGDANTRAKADGSRAYTYTVGTTTGLTAGAYNGLIEFASLTALGGTTQTVTYKVGTGADTTTNADVLKSIVALIASINKQIQALQKLILKR